MSLAPFSIIVATDGGNGIAKNGTIPWNSRSDMKFFRDTTVGRGRNAVIMGRTSYESISPEYRPLSGRHCVVVSRNWKQEDHPEIRVCPSLLDALATVGNGIKSYDEVFIAGGEQIYNEVINNFMYLCKKIHITRFKTDYECDQFFPWDAVRHYPTFQDIQKTRDFIRYFFAPNVKHEEYQYLDLLRTIADNGEIKPDRTGVGTQSIFGAKIEFNISERLPILTTKKVFYDQILKELLFFISGRTNTKILEEQNVDIWKDNTSRKFLDAQNLEYEEGDMGPGYGFQWRHWNATYNGIEEDYTGKGIDQLSKLIKNIRQDPHSRRHILTAWNPEQLQEMAIPPCHLLAQFNVSGDRKYLDCQVYQRSGDMFLGVPYNITSYCVLTYMIAHITRLKPRKFIHTIGDAHIYSTHGDQIKRQLARTPRPFPHLIFRGATKIHEIDDFNFDSFIIEGYTACPAISAPMAV
uniref:Bifunctional dihydrofolate reductase-thymidylate synthase n=1 Tax=Marseillevirus LCMAC102 TaxID=2506603 RepID=A0A481YTA4_9VIRU|nr:MAG: bifunctional dihydrofolate reductase-thymidylate synthase [Marseillevirus LCMAC102]